MSLIGEVIAGFLLESAVLAAAWSLLALLAAAGVTAATTGKPDREAIRRPWIGALAGAVAAGSLAHRFEAAEPWLPSIGRRDLPVIWSLGGALVGAVAVVVAVRRSARRSAAARIRL